jgi:hypothetical protein
MKNKNPKVLIIYSNPSNSSRLRLDKEHRSIDQIIDKLNIDSKSITRLHAASIGDFLAELSKDDFEIVQFSGHGSTSGIYLEAEQIDAGEEVSSKRLASLLKGVSSKLKVAIFVSCFSSDSIPDLAGVAPYLITICGPADDIAAIEFVRRFYESFFQHNSVEIAFETAVRLVGVILEQKNIHALLTRRAKELGEERFLLQAFPTGGDSILVDLTDVEKYIIQLNVTIEEFLYTLTR